MLPNAGQHLEGPAGEIRQMTDLPDVVNLRSSMTAEELRNVVNSNTGQDLGMLQDEKMAVSQAVMSTLSGQAPFNIPVEYLELKLNEGHLEVKKCAVTVRSAWPPNPASIFSEAGFIEDNELSNLASSFEIGVTVTDESGDSTAAYTRLVGDEPRDLNVGLSLGEATLRSGESPEPSTVTTKLLNARLWRILNSDVVTKLPVTLGSTGRVFSEDEFEQSVTALSHQKGFRSLVGGYLSSQALFEIQLG